MTLNVETKEQCKKCFHFQVCASTLKNDLYIREVMLGEKEPKCKMFVEVVRCKDCRFSAQHDIYDPMECVKWATRWGVVYTSPDGYCHKGERRTDG